MPNVEGERKFKALSGKTLREKMLGAEWENLKPEGEQVYNALLNKVCG